MTISEWFSTRMVGPTRLKTNVSFLYDIILF